MAAAAASWVLPALADDEDGSSPITGFFFAIAVILLIFITGGVAYLSFRDFLDRREETAAREEELRAERVASANEFRLKQESKKKRKKRLTPSQQAGALPNRRERRRMEREGDAGAEEE